jgi:hypothetical protein
MVAGLQRYIRGAQENGFNFRVCLPDLDDINPMHRIVVCSADLFMTLMLHTNDAIYFNRAGVTGSETIEDMVPYRRQLIVARLTCRARPCVVLPSATAAAE